MHPSNRFIQCYTHKGRIGVLVEFGLETHMVTERPEFVELSRNLAMHIAALNPVSVDALLHQAYVKEPSYLVKDALSNGTTILGEKISITRFVRWDNEPPKPPSQDPPDPKSPGVAVRLNRT